MYNPVKGCWNNCSIRLQEYATGKRFLLCDVANMYSKYLLTVLDRPWGFQEVEAPRFQDNRHMKVVRLSAIRTGRLFPPQEIFVVLVSLRGWVETRAIVRQEGLCEWNIKNDTTGNRTRDLPTCRAVPQPTAYKCIKVNFIYQLLHNWRVLKEFENLN